MCAWMHIVIEGERVLVSYVNPLFSALFKLLSFGKTSECSVLNMIVVFLRCLSVFLFFFLFCLFKWMGSKNPNIRSLLPHLPLSLYQLHGSLSLSFSGSLSEASVTCLSTLLPMWHVQVYRNQCWAVFLTCLNAFKIHTSLTTTTTSLFTVAVLIMKMMSSFSFFLIKVFRVEDSKLLFSFGVQWWLLPATYAVIGMLTSCQSDLSQTQTSLSVNCIDNLFLLSSAKQVDNGQSRVTV